jgi:hypothetical protein
MERKYLILFANPRGRRLTVALRADSRRPTPQKPTEGALISVNLKDALPRPKSQRAQV